MAYFPFMVDIEGKRCLIAGGGQVAYRKVKIVLDFGADVVVVAPDICRQIRKLEKQQASLQLHEREFADSDIEGADFVIAATDDEAANIHISDLCRKKNIPVNAVDIKEACSFIFPAIIREQDMVIAVSSGGKSPAAVSYVKDRIKEHLPKDYGTIVEALGAYREIILENVPDAKLRKQIFYELVEYGAAHDGEVPKELVEQKIRDCMGS